MLPLVCNDAACVLFMFDLSRIETLHSIREWYRQVSNECTRCAALLWPCPRCRAGGGRAHRAALRGFALLLEEEARPYPICLGRLCDPVRQQGVWCAR